MIGFLLGILVIVSTWIVFQKAGLAGWKSIIPIYGQYCLYKITWGNGWIFLALLIPIVNIVVAVMMFHKLSKCFGQGILFTLGLIFLPFVFMPILAFGNYNYLGPCR